MRDGVAILYGDAVQPPIINTGRERAILLFDKKEPYGHSGVAVEWSVVC